MRDLINQSARKVPAWTIYLAAGLAAVWLIWNSVSGAYGPDPVKALEKGLGERGLQILIASLAITPLRWWGINLLKFRRALGLAGFGFIMLHFAAWIVLDMGLRWNEVLHDLSKRPYIIVGFGALLAMIPLAVTSNNQSVKRLGAAAWRKLHWLAYPAILAGAVHFVMIGKVYTLESGLYLAAVVGLLLARMARSRSLTLLPA